MKGYGTGGLGADERAFKHVTLTHEFFPVTWIKNEPGEQLSSYALGLQKQIDTNKPFALLGVSFGGIVAQELCKFIKAPKLILILTIQDQWELRQIYRLVGRLKLVKLIPSFIFKLPFWLAKMVFSTNSALPGDILRDTDESFVKWALDKTLTWQSSLIKMDAIRIYGTKDRLFPILPNKGGHRITNGGHFMIVDEAITISKIINKELV